MHGSLALQWPVGVKLWPQTELQARVTGAKTGLVKRTLEFCTPLSAHLTGVRQRFAGQVIENSIQDVRGIHPIQ